MTNNQKIQKLNRVILSVLSSPNQSVQRAILWAKLVNLRSSLK
jgi:hypothetical protein